MSVSSRLFPIIGRRTALTFGLVTFLVAALLATVNITSRYALKTYVEDQLQRIPWDLAVYQKGTARDAGAALRARLRTVPGVTRVENLAFLRARFAEDSAVSAEVGGTPLSSPWMCLLAASDSGILPPGLGVKDATSGEGVLALVGPERAMGKAFRSLQGAREFTFNVTGHHDGHALSRQLFATPLQSVVRLDRDELNRWLMDQTGSVSYVPHVGVILLAPYSPAILEQFERAATGLLTMSATEGQGEDMGHVQTAEYEPELMYLARMDRAKLISGWDIPGSLDHVTHLVGDVDKVAHSILEHASRDDGPRYQLELAHEVAPGDEENIATLYGFTVDSTTQVLLARMERIARLIGVVTLLVALPLLWMGWVLAANLSGLLMLNERRTLGLMRLRGIPGAVIGRVLLSAILLGGFVGGALGLVAGSVGPLMIYERGGLPLAVLAERQQILLLLAFLVISLVLAVLVSRRLVRYATTISPLEASRRVAASEAARAALSFGVLQAVSLVLGSYVLVCGWVLNVTLSDRYPLPWLVVTDRLLDFLGLPFFLYGVTTLLASHRAWIQHVMAPVIRPLGGALGRLALSHTSAKPHRTMAFLLVVALMGSVSLYPTITSGSFADKATRGARVQVGTDWQLLFNAPDLVDSSRLKGGLQEQMSALGPEIERLIAAAKTLPGVADATYMVEGVLPNFYLPGHGLRGVPLFLLGDPQKYLTSIYAEPEVGVTGSFESVMRPVLDGSVAMSAPVSEFWDLTPGSKVMLGLDAQRHTLTTAASGTIAFLPGIPPRTVNDRQGYVQARVDYLNHLFSSHAYVVSAAANPKLAGMQLLLSRVIVLVSATPGTDVAALGQALSTKLPSRPLEMHGLAQEMAKVGSDMYISLALANMRIYLLGGFLLTAIAIIAVSLTNYLEDRRTLALLRIRGASPSEMWRFVIALLVSPALLGILLGVGTAVVAGYGLANYVWRLREIRTVVQLLPTKLVATELTAFVLGLIVVLLVGVATGFSWWVFRQTARQRMTA